MFWFAVVSSSSLILLALVQCSVAAAYWVRLGRPRPNLPAQPEFQPEPEQNSQQTSLRWPRVVVCLPLRGRDPILEQTLRAVVQLDYPDYRVEAIVDSENDPAAPLVRQIQTEPGGERLRLSLLTTPLETCSLKCSCELQLLDRLDAADDILAFVDADATPHRAWLTELVAPMLAQTGDITTGQRWFLVEAGDWGTAARFVWNVGAAAQVWLNGILWAGSMALTRSTAERIDAAAHLKGAFSDDGELTNAARDHGLRTYFVPQNVLLNPESIRLADFQRWMTRQLIAASTTGRQFVLVVAHAFAIAIAQIAALLCVSLEASLSSPSSGATESWYLDPLLLAPLIAWLAYAGSSLLIIESLDRRVRSLLAAQGREAPAHASGWRWRVAAAWVLVQFLFPAAVLAAMTARRVRWRGIEYQLLGQRRIRMLGYAPYASSAAVRETPRSAPAFGSFTAPSDSDSQSVL